MVSKKNFQQNSNVMPPQLRLSVRAAAAPYNKKPFKSQIMFGASQIPDNPGFMDFNNPTPPIVNPAPSNPPMKHKQPALIPPTPLQQKKKNNKNKQKQNNTSSNISKNKTPQQQHNSSWKNKQLPYSNHTNFNNNKYNNFNNTNNRYPNSMPRSFHGPQLNGPMRSRDGGGVRMFGVGQRNERMPPMVVPPPHGFQPPPIIPPMVPPPLRMGRGPMPGIPPMVNGGGPLPPPPPPPFMRRSARNMPPIPPPIPPMLIPPRIPRSGLPPSVPYNSIGGKIKKHNPKIIKKTIKAKSAIKTLKNLINQYPLDKPWVTNEIRCEHNKKLDIENRLKGNKNDELFAEFKLQRDKFVAMYEAARETYLKQEAAAVKAKDGGNKDKQKDSNTAAQNGNQRIPEAIPKSNNASNVNVNVDASMVNT